MAPPSQPSSPDMVTVETCRSLHVSTAHRLESDHGPGLRLRDLIKNESINLKTTSLRSAAAECASITELVCFNKDDISEELWVFLVFFQAALDELLFLL